MYNLSIKQQFPNLKTQRVVIRTIGVPFWQPPTGHFHNFNNRINPPPPLFAKLDITLAIILFIFFNSQFASDAC